MWKTPAQGGEAVQVTRQGGGSAFASPDGQHVYYVKEAPVRGIWSVPVNGGEEVRVENSFKCENFAGWAVVNDGIYFMNSDGRDSETRSRHSVPQPGYRAAKTDNQPGQSKHLLQLPRSVAR